MEFFRPNSTLNMSVLAFEILIPTNTASLNPVYRMALLSISVDAVCYFVCIEPSYSIIAMVLFGIANDRIPSPYSSLLSSVSDFASAPFNPAVWKRLFL
jgi:hypothetical protein